MTDVFRRRPGAAWGSLAVVSALLVGGVIFFNGLLKAQQGSTSVDRQMQHTGRQHAQALSAAFRSVAQEAAPSVVAIRTKTKSKRVRLNRGNNDQLPRQFRDQFGRRNPFEGTPFEDFFDDEFDGLRVPRQFGNGDGMFQMIPRREGLGSGVIIDAQNGVILTNSHVVDGADEITVRLHDGREYKASDVKTDPDSDLAVVRIPKAENLQAAKLGDSSNMEIGDWVVAVGSPFGLELSVTTGIVSAKGRGLASSQGVNFLQTDAAINPGNSGGPLFNLEGEVIGINTAIASRSGGFNGIGFAIPSNTAKWVSQQLVKDGQVRRAYLGVGIQQITNGLAEQFDVLPNSGVLISQVMPDTPAAKAGLKAGDIVTRFADREVSTPLQLQETVQQLPLGTTHTMEVLRDGQKRTLQVDLQARPEEFSLAQKRQSSSQDEELESTSSVSGLEVGDLSDRVASRLGLEGQQGVLITGVQPGSAAAEAGLEPGMLIQQVGGKTVQTVEEFQQAIKDQSSEGLLLLVRSRQGARFVALED